MKTFVVCFVSAFLVLASPACAVDPGDGDVGLPDPLSLGRDAVAKQHWQRAIDLLQKVILEQPNHADALNLLGFSSRKLGRWDQSDDYYRRALAVEPDHKGALQYQGALFLETGRLAQAERNLSRLRVLCPNGCDELTALEAAMGGESPYD